MNASDILQHATDFIWRNARLLDRQRFAYLFLSGEREPVLAALRPYQNADGGFGNALEPDFRGPVSQPLTVASAFEILDQIDAFGDPIVSRACDYLSSVTIDEGGVPFVLPSVREYTRAPWWEPPDPLSGSLVPTAGLAALLHKHGIGHPWRDRATSFCWHRVETLESSNPYEMRSVLPFLEHVPDRARAERAFDRIGPMIVDQNLVNLDPSAHAVHEAHTPLNFAPRPESIARPLFSNTVIAAHLDALHSEQQADGGWMFNWPAWNPATTLEWRGWLTIDSLLTLRAYGRLN